MSAGPYQSEKDVLALPEVRAILDSGHLRDGPVSLLAGALTRAGVKLSDYEKVILAWLGMYEIQHAAVIAGWIERAHEAGHLHVHEEGPRS